MMSKIPVVDEVIRSVQCIGDVCTGNTDRAGERWSNWTNDSCIGTAAKSSVALISAGIAEVDGNFVAAKKQLEVAKSNGEKLGAISLSCTSQVGGFCAQALTFGIPNPVSGACLQSSGGMNNVINECADKEGVNWDNFSKESLIGGAKGGASSGGIIPYTGTLVEQKLRGQETVVDHKQEWENWGMNIVSAEVEKLIT